MAERGQLWLTSIGIWNVKFKFMTKNLFLRIDKTLRRLFVRKIKKHILSVKPNFTWIGEGFRSIISQSSWTASIKLCRIKPFFMPFTVKCFLPSLEPSFNPTISPLNTAQEFFSNLGRNKSDFIIFHFQSSILSNFRYWLLMKTLNKTGKQSSKLSLDHFFALNKCN